MENHQRQNPNQRKNENMIPFLFQIKKVDSLSGTFPTSNEKNLQNYLRRINHQKNRGKVQLCQGGIKSV
jgi:hypothetical protein